MWPLGLGVAWGGNREWALCEQMRESLPVQRGATCRHQTQERSVDGLSKSRRGGERDAPGLGSRHFLFHY